MKQDIRLKVQSHFITHYEYIIFLKTFVFWRFQNFNNFKFMAIPTSRAKNKGIISIDNETCTGCGKCVSVCKVAATAAIYAGEALGLGTCMLGGVHPLIQNGKKAMQFRKKYSIKYKSREGLIVIFGYPDVEYRKGIRRSFASVTILN